MESNGQIILRYADADGAVSEAANPNGSMANVAGVASERGNVAGLMPHPERATESLLGSDHGLVLLRSFVSSLSPARV